MLSLAGYDVTAFPSAEAFLERGESDLPACIILDLRLPRMQGLELHRQLERHHGHVAVVFITSDQQLADSNEVRTVGRRCLVKPLDEPELFEAISQATGM
jgi:FixJ family two-component response regulator